MIVEGQACGRIKDLYFDSRSWRVCWIVAAVGVQRSLDDLKLIPPSANLAFQPSEGLLQLPWTRAALDGLPTAAQVRPVCRQYASLRWGSPASAAVTDGSNPHLRSWNAVRPYQVQHEDETVGSLTDLLCDEADWSIQRLRISRESEGKLVHTHILPSAVDAISFAAQRITLRTFQPKYLNEPPGPGSEPMIHAA